MEIILSTINQNDVSHLIKKMNISSDLIVINQNMDFLFEEKTLNGKTIKIIQTPEKGIGLSRNTGLMRASKSVCLFADDDVQYVDNYEELIEEEFQRLPKADIILFNIKGNNPSRPIKQNKKSKKIINSYQLMKYGAVRIAFRKDSIKKANVAFSLLFGGGAKYSSGEDSLFLKECFKKKLKIYTSSICIGNVDQSESSWYQGYNKKYFFDKGALFYNLSPRFSNFLVVQFIIRHRKKFEKNMSFYTIYDLFQKGKKDFLN